MSEIRNNASLIWGIAELLRGDYRQADYGKVILPLVVMRRLDQVLEGSKDKVLEQAEKLEARGIKNTELALRKAAGQQFFNRSPLRMAQILEDPPHVAQNFRAYIDGYSELAREVIEKFDFDRQIDKLEREDLLYQVLARVCEVDLHPDRISNIEMGYLFEELIRRFSEVSNETAGEHFTPREVVHLMVNLLLDGDEEILKGKGVIRTVYDCACGTGGMLAETDDRIHDLNSDADVHLYGQELNAESYAICLADMLVRGEDASHIAHGNTLSNDLHPDENFHYCIANPPFGVDWSKVEREVRAEHTEQGFDGRFGPGVPKKSDGQLLFQLHLISKMRDPAQGGTRIGIVHNGSPLFSGAAGSGESEIRRWIIENDLLEAIVALPEQLFYNTGISSYIWLLSNRKPAERAGKVQLIDARELYVKMRKSLGEKRREISASQIEEITSLHRDFSEGELVKIVPNESFGYRTITVDQPLRARWRVGETTWEGVEEESALAKLESEQRSALIEELGRMSTTSEGLSEEQAKEALKSFAVEAGISRPGAPLLKALAARMMVRDSEAPIVTDKNGDPVADPQLRDTEQVPLAESVEKYVQREVLPHVPDAWVADTEGKVGYEIPFTRLFYRYTPPRPSAEIKAELRELGEELQSVLQELAR